MFVMTVFGVFWTLTSHAPHIITTWPLSGSPLLLTACVMGEVKCGWGGDNLRWWELCLAGREGGSACLYVWPLPPPPPPYCSATVLLWFMLYFRWRTNLFIHTSPSTNICFYFSWTLPMCCWCRKCIYNRNQHEILNTISYSVVYVHIRILNKLLHSDIQLWLVRKLLKGNGDDVGHVGLTSSEIAVLAPFCIPSYPVICSQFISRELTWKTFTIGEFLQH